VLATSGSVHLGRLLLDLLIVLDLAAMNRTRAALKRTDKTFTRTKHSRN